MLSDRLGTARLQDACEVASNYPFETGKFWLGRAEDGTALGYRDDRHICLIAGTRSGKGASIIINNLCLWPGSAVVIDPKGENASVTAARRGQGDEYCTGMGQDVHVLDPFNAAKVDDCYRSSFNPLAGLDIEDEETLEEAHRIANALVIVHEDTKDGPWDEQARTLVRGLILHVLSADRFNDSQRNLPTVAELVQCGDRLLAASLRAALPDDKQIDQPHLLLFKAMELNPAFGGRVARIGSIFRTMLQNSAKQFQGVLQSATANTEFLDSPGMIRALSGEGRTFRLSELKTNPRGVTLYLSLPLRQLRNTHYRWLRMMIDLITTQMEITRGNPATGHPLLMWLDEFRALQRMDSLQAAAPYIAGFGMKLAFVVQTLKQLEEVYKDGWETFYANAGLKLIFSIDDNFTRDYVSKNIGVFELRRELHNVNESQSENESHAEGRSQSDTLSQSTTRGTSQSVTDGTSVSETRGTSRSASQSRTEGTSRSVNQSRTHGVNRSRTETQSSGGNQSESSSRGTSTTTHGPGGLFGNVSYGRSSSRSKSSGTSYSTSRGTSEGTSSSFSRGETEGVSSSFTNGLTCGTSYSDTQGQSRSTTTGLSSSDSLGSSQTTGTSETRTTGLSRTAGAGHNETIHRRPLLEPDEVGRHFERIKEKDHPHYPGLALVIVSGADPMIVRRVNYFEDPLFIDCFSPHPENGITRAVSYSLSAKLLEQEMRASTLPSITAAEWLIAPGQIVLPGEAAAAIDGGPPDNPAVHILIPWFGKVTTAPKLEEFPDGEGYRIPDGNVFTVKNYPECDQDFGIDPFAEIRALPRRNRIQAPQQTPPQPFLVPQPLPAPRTLPLSAPRPLPAPQRRTSYDFPWAWIGGALAVGAIGVALYFVGVFRLIIAAAIIGLAVFAVRATMLYWNIVNGRTGEYDQLTVFYRTIETLVNFRYRNGG
jgi:type IV secretory pathway TraG/TraD family ATPase VirD4